MPVWLGSSEGSSWLADGCLLIVYTPVIVMGLIASPFSYKATILVHSLNYLLKTLSPDAVTLGVRASTYARKSWEHNSVHSNIKRDSKAHRAPFSPTPRHPSLQIWHLSESTDPFVLFSGQQIVFLVLCQHLFFL